MIAVAIILAITAIAIPNLVQARVAANESSALASIRTIHSAMVTYKSSYPAIGFAANLSRLGGAAPCTPSSITACLIDNGLASGTRNGYTFTAVGAGGPPAVEYWARALPITLQHSGLRSFCSFEDGVVLVQPSGAAINSEAACQVLQPLNP